MGVQNQYTAKLRRDSGAFVRRAADLEAVNAALIGAQTIEQITTIVTQQAVVSLRARIGLVNLITDDRCWLRAVAITDTKAERLRHLPPIPMSVDTPTTRALASGQPVWITATSALGAQFPHLIDFPMRLPNESLAILPLQDADTPLGVLIFGFTRERDFPVADRWFMQTLAHHCTLALMRARLYERERDARAAAEMAHERLQFLAAASSVLSTTLDLEKTLRRAVELAIPTLADWCIIDLDGEHGLERAIVAHSDPADPRRVRIGEDRAAVDPATGDLFAQAVAHGRALLLTEQPPQTLAPLTDSAAARERLSQLTAISRIVIPLLVPACPFGILTLIAAESGREYGPDDVAVAEEFAYRVAVALGNSHRYREVREAEGQLQQRAERLRTLAEVSRRLAEVTTDIRTSLGPILAWLTPSLGDGCLITQIAMDGTTLEPIASWFRSPKLAARASAIFETHRFAVGSGVQGTVAETGEPQIVAALDAVRLDGERPPWWPQLEEYGRYSAIVVPVRRVRILGTLLILRDEHWAPYTTEELLILQDIADRVALAIDNDDLHVQRKDLVKKLITTQEDERRYVAYEIHDSLAQIAVAAHQHLQAYASLHQPRSPQAKAALADVATLVQRTVDEARQVIANLRPLILDDFGLTAAVRAQIDTCEAAGWCVEFVENLGRERLPPRLEIVLFRVAQEALTNARKYAGETPLAVTIERLAGEVRLTVQDWGAGFAPEQAALHAGPGERIGLVAMRERLTLVEGRLQISTAPGQGTRIVAVVPLPSMMGHGTREGV